MKYFIQTFGCQMNANDSDLIAGHLLRQGFSSSDDPKKADLIILNTCSVRQQAEHKAASFLGRLEPLKKKNKDLKIVVAGCMAERAGKELQKRFPIVDLVIGAKKIGNFAAMLSDELGIEAGTPAPAPGRSAVSSFVTIMRGCGNFCSYCIVPYVRGPETSREAGEIVSEVEALAAAGARDVMLLGQNVNSYKDGALDFAALLEKINGVKDVQRVRFMTSHPKDLGERLIDAMAGLDKVCEHVHLPLQSGSNRILEAMNRKYTAARYVSIVEALKRKIPGASITTDILVGFPGETEDDHRQTMRMIEDTGFDSLFVFSTRRARGPRRQAP
jgi:tRNA-N(6)-(isopentenyl)adenosine-37 thiotransferase enzyme MiaB